MNSLPKTVIRQRRDCDLNLSPSTPESSMLTTQLPSHPLLGVKNYYLVQSYDFLTLTVREFVHKMSSNHNARLVECLSNCPCN